MEATKKLTFDRDTMATTVGANSLNVEAIVSQPSNDQADLMVDGLDYVFDQAKFEEYLSSSSSKSSSPRKHRRISSPKREVRSVIVRNESRPLATEVSPRDNTPANCKVGSSAHDDSIQKKESSHKISTALTKRAHQRQRQKLALQFAKALESTDGVHYHMNSRDQRHQQTTTPQSQPVSTPAKEEWILVKRIRLTKKERAQKRRAHIARARAIIRKAHESRSTGESNRSKTVWIPKSACDDQKLSRSARDSANCLAGRETVQTVAPATRKSKLSHQPCDSERCRAQRPHDRDTPNCLGQGGSSPHHSSASPANPSTSVFSRLGP